MMATQSDTNLINNYKIAVDIGNSRIKLAINEEFFSFDYYDNWKSELVNLLESIDGNKILAYSSVNSNHEEIFLELMQNFPDIDLIKPKELINSQKLIKFGHIQGMGFDRMFGLIGAVSYDEPALITVDCGTAITVNAVDDDGICRGGAIFAGLYTQIKALAEHTDKLKNLSINEYEHSFGIGKNTNQALTMGVMASSIGGIQYLIEKIKFNEFNRKNIPIFITGGYAKLLLNYLSEKNDIYQHKENLVLDGIMTLL